MQLRQHAQTADLVLFKSKGFLATALRTVAKMSYDHIGILVCYQGLIYIVEATSDLGVTFSSVDDLRLEGWRRDYSKVVYRKLTCERSEAFEKTIVKCLREWVGCPYELSVAKLMRNKSIAACRTDFFCSQLVAAFYKRLNLLPQDSSACIYWPSSFAAQRKLPLPSGVSLSEEMFLTMKV